MDPGDPLPFEDVFVPWVVAAGARLPTAERLLSDDARGELERILLRRLAGLNARTLHLEFSIARAGQLSPLARLIARGAAEPPRDAYQAFVDRMRTAGLDSLAADYPVLAGLNRRVTELWIEAVSELVARLERDRDQIGLVFARGAPLGPVVAVDTGLSDPHRGGRMVAGLTFASGLRLAYKPKDLGSERAFNDLLRWCNEHGAPLAMRTLTVLERPGYGWVEWVERAPCADDEAASRYYRRAGMLLCLVYALAGSDCHRDNLIAAAEHPMLVDTESLMHPRARVAGELTGAWALARDQLISGVLGTCMLPSWQVAGVLSPEHACDISALHTVSDQELVLRAPIWEHINSDGMTLTTGSLTHPLPANQPLVGERRLRLEDHAGELLGGFERFYAFLLEHRDALLATDGPLQSLFGQPVRFLYRSTRVYGALHDQLRDPAYLRDEDATRALLERLHGIADDEDEPGHPRWRALVESEIEAMAQLDVPLFTAPADGTSLILNSGERLERCLREPAAELVVARLRSLGSGDLARQIGFISGSLYANSARHGGPAARPVPAVDGHAAGARSWKAELDSFAIDIAAEMAEHAIRSRDDGGASWIAPQYLPQLERYQLQPISHDLHSGACGIALFLAALEHVGGHGEHGELALAALQPVLDDLVSLGDKLADHVGAGAASGLGSIVYALTRIGVFLGEHALLGDAAAVAGLLTDERIELAPLDVFGGLAGEILGLLALHRVTADPAILARAQACGDRLLAVREADVAGNRGWRTFKGRMLTGFSHGTAGIAYALARLSVASADAGYGRAAREAMEQENQLFDGAKDNWRDLRGDVQPDYRVNWCHGAPGIGLARVGGMAAVADDRVEADIEAALRLTLNLSLEGPDHLCCGNLGRADFLLAAGERLDRPELIAAGRERVQRVARRARRSGGFTLDDALPIRVYIPGFFQGLAGVGYEMLRARHPRHVPCALLWE